MRLSLTQVEDFAVNVYKSVFKTQRWDVSRVLAATLGLAGITPRHWQQDYSIIMSSALAKPNAAYDDIASRRRLAWLLRNPLIGTVLNFYEIHAKCFVPNYEKWCFETSSDWAFDREESLDNIKALQMWFCPDLAW